MIIVKLCKDYNNDEFVNDSNEEDYRMTKKKRSKVHFDKIVKMRITL
jgi:hypothetical protein